MAFTAQDVKALREKTGVGMMECKKALQEADGDMDKAIEYLRERGLAAATKKAGRAAAEGAVLAYTDEAKKLGVLVEVNSETDFVGKNEKFQAFVLDVAKTIADKNPADVEDLLGVNLNGTDRTVQENLQDLILSIGENMKIRRFARVEGLTCSYIHGGGERGVLVEIDTDDATFAKEECKAMGKNLAMQIAAMSPEYLAQSDILADELDKMKNIIVESSLNTPDTLPKPILTKVIAEACEKKLWSDADIAAYEEQKNNKFLFNFLSEEAKAALAQIAVAHKAEFVEDKIFSGAVDGRFKKQLKEICLLEQAFVRTDLFDGTVGGYVADVAKKLGADIKIKNFTCYVKGEGLEKKEENFADEIAKMVNG
ncbi:MAG: elongation factor Ts [Clostridia bacterium]|nr:elongation factor Ts [Clostridia bacterium]